MQVKDLGVQRRIESSGWGGEPDEKIHNYANRQGKFLCPDKM